MSYVNNWISVDENLPPDGKRVLVALNTAYAGERVHLAARSDKDWFSDCGDMDFVPAFWMPLPEAPEPPRQSSRKKAERVPKLKPRF
jgi:hypothetical protein